MILFQIRKRIKGKGDNKKKKKERKKTVLFSFTCKRQVVLKIGLKASPSFYLLKTCCQKQIAIMTQCIKHQQTKKQSLEIAQ